MNQLGLLGPCRGDRLPSQSFRDEPEYTGITKAKVERVALYTLSGVSAGAGVVTLIRGEKLWSIPPLLASFGAFRWAKTIKDYGDTRELNKMRAEAEGWPFKKVIAKHGLENTVKHQILDPGTLQRKFAVCCKDSVLSDVLKDYPFSVIEQYQLDSESTLRICMLSELKVKKFGEVDIEFLTQCNKAKLLADDELNAFHAFFTRAEELLNRLEENKKVADARYPDRLGKLMERFKKEEDRARKEAKDLENKIRTTGYNETDRSAATRTLSDAFNMNATRETLADRHHTRVVQGVAVAEQIARIIATGELSKKLADIKERREEAQNNPDVKRHEALYSFCIQVEEKRYKEGINRIEALFKKSVDALWQQEVRNQRYSRLNQI